MFFTKIDLLTEFILKLKAIFERDDLYLFNLFLLVLADNPTKRRDF